MGRKRTISLACAIAMLVAFSFASPASATPSTDVSGTWDWDIVTLETDKEAGGNVFFHGTEVTARTGWSGDFEGDSFDTLAGVSHRVSGELWLTVYFDGSVLGRSGTMVMDVSCLVNYGHGFAGKWFIRSGTDGLEGLHGNGTWGWGGEMAVYTGSVHWE